MLYSLHVKNLALIKEQEIEFSKGLNILTGETGAGKSVIIGSVNLALGGKADASLIRTGEEYALVELVFGVDNDLQRQRLKEMDIPVEEDGTLILQRKIMQGRSVSKIGGESVSARQLKDISGILINIHGQNDHQELLHKKKHIEILDDYCQAELAGLFAELGTSYSHMRDLEKELSETDIDESARIREQELLEYEIGEIEDAALVAGEDEELESSYRKMVNAQKISGAVYQTAAMVNSKEGEESASDLVGRAVREISSVVSYDEALEDLLSQLTDIENLLGDFGHQISDYIADLEFDDEKFRTTEDRLNTINHLKDKYGGSIEAVLKYLDDKSKRLDALSDLGAHRDKLMKELAKEKEKALLLCKKISDVRKEGAKGLSEKLRAALVDLNFLDVRFEIEIKSDEDKISSKGYDDAQFMISTNPGEAMRPLDQIASGGELSRIMLALKTVVADKDDISTLIFDEIDVGISGITAERVGNMMKHLGASRQIISITHLPQIACVADTAYVIEKEVRDDKTMTGIRKLDEEGRVLELARLLGGANVTDAVIESAREMINRNVD